MSSPARFAIVASHPIQHFAAYYRALAAHPQVRLRTIFMSRGGADGYFDREMNCDIVWRTNLLEGYDHCFLPQRNRFGSTGVTAALRTFAPHAVLAYGYSGRLALEALVACKAMRIPLMMTGDSELLRARSVIARAAKSFVLPRILNAYSAILSIGDENRRYWREYGVRDDVFFHVPLPIDEPAFLAARAQRDALRAAFRAQHKIADDECVALFVGKLSARKRPGDLLRAMRRVKGERRLRAIFAGSGALHAQLRAAPDESDAIFLGFVNLDALPQVYAAADILVHPAEHDPHPLVCAEAACMGLPLLLSDRVGAAGAGDIARPHENALQFPCGDTEALAKLLILLHDDMPVRRRMSEASQNIYDSLNLQRSVAGTLAALDHCLGARRDGADDHG